jgi:hypothetical protein
MCWKAAYSGPETAFALPRSISTRPRVRTSGPSATNESSKTPLPSWMGVAVCPEQCARLLDIACGPRGPMRAPMHGVVFYARTLAQSNGQMWVSRLTGLAAVNARQLSSR